MKLSAENRTPRRKGNAGFSTFWTPLPKSKAHSPPSQGELEGVEVLQSTQPMEHTPIYHLLSQSLLYP